MEMQKQVKHPLWKQFWWFYIRSRPGSEYQHTWVRAWSFYLAGVRDQAVVDEMATSSRPDLVRSRRAMQDFENGKWTSMQDVINDLTPP